MNPPMTEEEWLHSADPEQLLGFLRPPISERGLRLFACACCRRIWPIIESRRSMEGVVVAERYADSLPGGEKLPMAARTAWHASRRISAIGAAQLAARAAHRAAQIGGELPARERALEAARLCAEAAAEIRLDGWGVERAAQAHLVRDVFGNLFRPLPELSPEYLTWKDGTVVRLAQTIREGGNFDEVPVLADALEDAGCTDSALLDHCRLGGPHVRGCWAVDLVLGKR